MVFKIFQDKLDEMFWYMYSICHLYHVNIQIVE